MTKSSTDIAVVHSFPVSVPNVAQSAAIRRHREASGSYVSHWGKDEVVKIAEAASQHGRHRDRDKLLIQFIFDSCCRVSEAISVRPKDIVQDGNGWRIAVLGKGQKRGVVAVSAGMVAQMQAYCYRNSIDPETRIFAITRRRVFEITQVAVARAGITKPDGVGCVHCLRHSGALERLRLSGNPRSVQSQLRHASPAMTLRYFRTLADQESLKIQQQVDFGW